MQPHEEHPPAATSRSALIPLGVGAAMAAAATYTLVRPPGGGAWYPPCAFHAATGLWCPGCGLTRGVHAMLTGDVAAAIGFNVFTPVVMVAALVGWFTWLQHTRGRTLPWTGWRPPPWFAVVAPLVLVAFAVVRNLPVAPLDALAP
jgi:hypothetical protein